MYVIAGLGNPGADYVKTRHNTGRMAVQYLAEKLDIHLETEKKYLGVAGKGRIGESDVLLLCPDTYMNKSGSSVAKVVRNKKAAEKLVVVYDDLDLPVGTMKVSYDRGSGGHKGIESITRSLKTREFVRVRIGISPVTTSGKMKKIIGENLVERHIMGTFSPKEKELLERIFERTFETIKILESEGLGKAMTVGNSQEL